MAFIRNITKFDEIVSGRWVISPGNVQLPINVVVSIILALASLMSNIFLIQTPITIFDRSLA